MNKTLRIMALGIAAFPALTSMAFGVGSYDSEPMVEESGSDAGLILVVAITALLVINSIVAPKPSASAKDAEDRSE